MGKIKSSYHQQLDELHTRNTIKSSFSMRRAAAGCCEFASLSRCCCPNRFNAHAVHLLVALIYCSTLTWVLKFDYLRTFKEPAKVCRAQLIGGHWRFLTMWNLALQSLIFGLFVLQDVFCLLLGCRRHLEDEEQQDAAHQQPASKLFLAGIANNLFHSLAAPFGLVSDRSASIR